MPQSSPAPRRNWVRALSVASLGLTLIATVAGTVAVTIHQTVPPPKPTVRFFAGNHKVADARTVVAIVQYLLTPEKTLVATNQPQASGQGVPG